MGLGDYPPSHSNKLKVGLKVRATLGMGNVLQFDYDSSGLNPDGRLSR